MIKIRRVSHDEVPMVAEFAGKPFYQEKNLPGTFNAENFVKSWGNIFDTLTSVMFVAEDETPDGKTVDGALAGIAYPDIYNARLVAAELFMYTRPGANVWTMTKLIKAFHKWAQKNGAVETRMTHIIDHGLNNSDERLEKYYRKLGYRPFEINWLREVKGGS